MDFKNLDTDYFSLELSTEEIIIYSAIVNSKAFKRDIKLAVAVFLKDGKEIARKLYFSTDLEQEGVKIVRYYRSRFQIEFISGCQTVYRAYNMSGKKRKQARLSF